MTWEKLANCRSDGVDPDWFFPASMKSPEAELAKTVCSWCVVRAQCEAASQRERYGIWGGIDERERREPEGDASAQRELTLHRDGVPNVDQSEGLLGSESPDQAGGKSVGATRTLAGGTIPIVPQGPSVGFPRDVEAERA